MEKEQPAGSAEANTLLTTLLGRAPASVPAAGSTSASRRRQRASTYDRVTRSVGLVVALLLMVALWLTGGYFTLQFLASLGVRVASAGLAPVAWLLGLPQEQGSGHWLWAVAAWSLPAAISAAEIGLWPQRVVHPAIWLIWAAFPDLRCLDDRRRRRPGDRGRPGDGLADRAQHRRGAGLAPREGRTGDLATPARGLDESRHRPDHPARLALHALWSRRVPESRRALSPDPFPAAAAGRAAGA